MLSKKRILLLGIVLIAFFFRFQNLNWDSGYHLHPDERFLTMVGNAMKVPSSLGDYLDPSTSPMNPPNIGYSFFVYGVFPVVMTKIIALVMNADTYNALTIIGRIITGFLDIIIVVLVYRSAQLLEEEKIFSYKIKYWAAFLYAVAVLPVQYAHFFTTDTFLNFFLFAAFYTALLSYRRGTLASLIATSLFFGLAVASKINAVLIVPLLLFLLLIRPLRKRNYLESANILAIFLIVSYLVIRFGAPYYFQNSDFFSLSPNTVFTQSITALKSFEGKDVQYPPALQWIHTVPVVFPVLNLALFGLGLPAFLLLVVGTARLVKYVYGNRHRLAGPLVGIIFGWVFLVFVYESVQFVKVMRYFLFLYPYFAILAGWGGEGIVSGFSAKAQTKALLGAIVLTLIWPLIFSTIYLTVHTRVLASYWIYQHVPDNATILSEYWDDALPLQTAYLPPKTYRSETLSVFDPDTPSKWQKIGESLKSADYYILSSNRGWGTLPSIPERFPQSTKFYQELFAGKMGYTLAKSFYPTYNPCNYTSFLCTRILSNWFDESFTVYDSPTVYIFKNTAKR